MHEEWREDLQREREARGLAGPVELDDTPELQVLQRRAVALAEPYVRQAREELFGSPEPRWADDQEGHRQAIAWLTDKASASLDEQARDKGDRVEYREHLEHHYKRLVELTGRHWHATDPKIPYVINGGSTVAHAPYALGSPLETLEQTANEVSAATGFEPARVVEWVLTGAVPRLIRASLQVEDKHGSLGERSYSRRTVTVTLRSALREADFRRLFRHIRRAWMVGESFDFSPAAGREGRVLTQLDRHLQSIVERLPLADYTWTERLAAWRGQAPDGWVGEEWGQSRHALVTADTLRRRWARLEEKLQRQGHTPQEDTDDEA